MTGFDDRGSPHRFGMAVRAAGDGVVVVALSGEIDLTAAARLSPVLSEELTRARLVVVDLTDVVMLGSAGIAVLLGNHRRARGGRQLRLVTPHPRTHDPLVMLGLTDLLHVYRSLDAALAGR